MTDRYAGYVVILDKHTREDDAQVTISAIKQLKGVMDVEPVMGDPKQHIAECKARSALFNKFLEWYEGT